MLTVFTSLNLTATTPISAQSSPVTYASLGGLETLAVGLLLVESLLVLFDLVLVVSFLLDEVDDLFLAVSQRVLLRLQLQEQVVLRLQQRHVLLLKP